MLKPFDPARADEVMDIWLSANLSAHPFIPENYFTGNYELVRSMLNEALIIVYERGGRICGFAGVTEKEGGQAYVNGMFVQEGCRGKGIGGALMDALQARYGAIALHVYKANERALAFYKRRGFDVESEGLDEETGQLEYLMRWSRA